LITVGTGFDLLILVVFVHLGPIPKAILHRHEVARSVNGLHR
jgi:hypothetical protein